MMNRVTRSAPLRFSRSIKRVKFIDVDLDTGNRPAASAALESDVTLLHVFDCP